MSSRNRPSNWYDMDYDAQRAWEKQDRARSDAEYEADRAREDAERATRNAAQERQERESERYRHQEAANEYAAELEEANDQIARLEESNTELLDKLDAVQCYCPVHVQDEIRALIVKVKGADDGRHGA